MKTQVDTRLRREADEYRFRFSCEHCAYFDEEGDSCSEGYPTDEHRSADLSRAEILFCKLFEGA